MRKASHSYEIHNILLLLKWEKHLTKLAQLQITKASPVSYPVFICSVSVLSVVSDSCSWLTSVEPNTVVCCCSSSIFIQVWRTVRSVMPFPSPWLLRVIIILELPHTSYEIETVCPFCSGFCHQQGISAFRAPGCFLFFSPFGVNCAKLAVCENPRRSWNQPQNQPILH